MQKTRKILAVTLLAIVTGFVTIGPAMADKDSAAGQNKIEICHLDKESGTYKKLSIPQKAADRHEKNHEGDIIPAPPEGCGQVTNEEDNEDNSLDMDSIMDMFTEVTVFEQEVQNLQNQIDNLNTGSKVNFKIGNYLDEDGSQWDPNDSQRHFEISDEAIGPNSVVTITIFNPDGVNPSNPECNGHIVEKNEGVFVLRIDCVSWVPEGTQLNYVIMNP